MEIVLLVEEIFQRRALIRYSLDADNALDNTFRRSSRPNGWNPTDLAYGVKATALRLHVSSLAKVMKLRFARFSFLTVYLNIRSRNSGKSDNNKGPLDLRYNSRSASYDLATRTGIPLPFEYCVRSLIFSVRIKPCISN